MKRMHDPKSLTLALLCITASLLLATIILVGNEKTALAGSSESRAGDYIMVAGQISSGSELIYLIDIGAQRLNGYGANVNTRTVELVPGCVVDLKLAFETDAGR